jgi:hypothetical protein
MQIFISYQLRVARGAWTWYLLNYEDSNNIEDTGLAHLAKTKGNKLKKLYLGIHSVK